MALDTTFWLENQELVMEMELVLTQLESVRRFIENDVPKASDSPRRTRSMS